MLDSFSSGCKLVALLAAGYSISISSSAAALPGFGHPANDQIDVPKPNADLPDGQRWYFHEKNRKWIWLPEDAPPLPPDLDLDRVDSVREKTITADERKEVGFLLAGLRESIGSLSSGVAKFDGFLNVSSQETSWSYNGPVSGQLAFDEVGGSWKYEISLPVMLFSSVPTEQVVEPRNFREEKPVLSTATLHSTRTSEHFAWFMGGDGPHTLFNVQEPSAPWGETTRGHHFVFDPRTAGLVSLPLIAETAFGEDVPETADQDWIGSPASVLSFLENRIALATAIEVDEVSGHTKVSWLRQELTLSSHGHVLPVKIQSKNNRSGLEFETIASWSSREGSLVPTNVLFTMANAKDGSTMELQLDYTWTDVNQSIPESIFGINSLSGIPDSTAVVDSRGNGESKVIGQMRSGVVTTDAEMVIEEDSWRIPILWLACGLAVLLVLIFAAGGSQKRGAAH